MAWTVSTAREHLAEVLVAAKKKPQPIYRRNKLVGGVVDAETMRKMIGEGEPEQPPTIEDAFAELREILAETGETFPAAPERFNRPNALVAMLEEEDDAL